MLKKTSPQDILKKLRYFNLTFGVKTKWVDKSFFSERTKRNQSITTKFDIPYKNEHNHKETN